MFKHELTNAADATPARIRVRFNGAVQTRYSVSQAKRDGVTSDHSFNMSRQVFWPEHQDEYVPVKTIGLHLNETVSARWHSEDPLFKRSLDESSYELMHVEDYKDYMKEQIRLLEADAGRSHDNDHDDDDDDDDDDGLDIVDEGTSSQFRQRSLITTAANGSVPLTASETALEKAKHIVEQALLRVAELNTARYTTPLRNRYALKPKKPLNSTKRDVKSTTPALFEITDEVAAAAALLTEANAPVVAANHTKRATGSYWMAQIARRGTVPWGPDPNYKVFRNVMDYGAVGDGSSDDSAAIKKAMTDGNRCGKGCNGSTTKNAIVYFPPGRYLVSSTIPMPFGTQVIGDASNWPTLVASESFIGLGVLSADEYTGNGSGIDGGDQEYYINTANFYRQVRNLRIDVTRAPMSSKASCIHWQVGQATSLQNLELIASAASNQSGIFTENGSGGVLSDITFTGGAYGIYGGDQQFTAQRLTFNGCSVGVQVIWDWGWIWKSVTMNNVGVGFKLVPETASTGKVGSCGFMDSSFNNVGTAILIQPANSDVGSGSTGVYLENVAFSGTPKAVVDTSGTTLLVSQPKIDSWILGPTYMPRRSFVNGRNTGNYNKQISLLDASGKYFERAKPQYEDRPASDFISVKTFGARGDAVTDDTAALQKALYAAVGKVLFVDAGSYIITSTVLVPSGSVIVGEAWSQLVASGSYFGDPLNPKVMLKIGNHGDIGTVEMQDLLFTNVGATSGLIMVQWNIQASSQGAAALWDCHTRIGGAVGTHLTFAQCNPSGSINKAGCKAGSLMMHITNGASGYFENMWLWVADHDIDDTDTNDANNDMPMISVYNARGLLVESVDPVWLYGTASEHSVYYQYNFNGAKNVFGGIIQTESPYYQPAPAPPMPFPSAVGKLTGDPVYDCAKSSDDFSGCDESWALIIQNSANIHIAGAGLYSWFSNYAQTCVDSGTCQKTLILLKNNFAGIRFRNLITIGAKYMWVEDGKGVLAADNLNVKTHPDWSQLTAVDFAGNGTMTDQMIWISPSLWDMPMPSVSCSAPCVMQLPPWRGATSTINYPIVTVSSGAWTSKITRAPLTVQEVLWQPVTITTAGGQLGKRALAVGDTFFPTPATIPHHSPLTYSGPDGKTTVTTPSGTVPQPPTSIGTNAPPPPTGRWPPRAVQVFKGSQPQMEVLKCLYDDFTLCPDPWTYGNLTKPVDPSDDGDDEADAAPNGGGPEDAEPFVCVAIDVPDPKVSSSSSSSASSSASPIPAAVTPHLAAPSPMENRVECYNQGRVADFERLSNAILSSCRALLLAHPILNSRTYFEDTEWWDYRLGEPAALKVDMTLDFKNGCEWSPSLDECHRYGLVTLNSCNCEGVDTKQGGIVRNNCFDFRVDPNNR